MRRCLIIGCADNVWADVAAARDLGDYDAIYCVKLAGVHWPAKFQVWATLHPEYMQRYQADRRALGYPNGYEIVAPPPGEVGRHGQHPADRRVSYRWPGMSGSASSGIYAAKVALDDGFDRVVLAGIPMTREGGHFTRGRRWEQLGAFMPGFESAVPYLLGKVKSLSGHTREVLGAPTSPWLCGEE